MSICMTQEGFFYLLMWPCPIVQTYWPEIVNFLHGHIGSPLFLDPKLCLLGLLPDPNMVNFQTIFLHETIFYGKLIAKNLDADNPSHT